MDTIFIRELRLDAWVGLHRHEKLAPQSIELEIEIGLPGDTVFRSGKVGDTIDYGVVVQHVRALLEKERFGLVESRADRVAALILEDFKAPRVKVTVVKLGVLREAKRVGATVERGRA